MIKDNNDERKEVDGIKLDKRIPLLIGEWKYFLIRSLSLSSSPIRNRDSPSLLFLASSNLFHLVLCHIDPIRTIEWEE